MMLKRDQSAANQHLVGSSEVNKKDAITPMDSSNRAHILLWSQPPMAKSRILVDHRHDDH
jgi:hypothetical protein